MAVADDRRNTSDEPLAKPSEAMRSILATVGLYGSRKASVGAVVALPAVMFASLITIEVFDGKVPAIASAPLLLVSDLIEMVTGKDGPEALLLRMT